MTLPLDGDATPMWPFVGAGFSRAPRRPSASPKRGRGLLSWWSAQGRGFGRAGRNGGQSARDQRHDSESRSKRISWEESTAREVRHTGDEYGSNLWRRTRSSRAAGFDWPVLWRKHGGARGLRLAGEIYGGASALWYQKLMCGTDSN